MNVTRAVKKIDKWVYLKAVQNCKEEFHLTLLRGINYKKPSPADRDTMNLIAFNDIGHDNMVNVKTLPDVKEDSIAAAFEMKKIQLGVWW